jgi:hypothetical protein
MGGAAGSLLTMEEGGNAGAADAPGAKARRRLGPECLQLAVRNQAQDGGVVTIPQDAAGLGEADGLGFCGIVVHAPDCRRFSPKHPTSVITPAWGCPAQISQPKGEAGD